MTNAVATMPQTQLTASDKYDQADVIAAIKQTVCKGASDAQLKMFIEVCRTTGLNPWLREIWFVAEKSIIMAGRDGYLRVANEHPQFDGIETRVERNAQSIPVKAVCTVWRKDRSHPTICEAYYNEYKSGSPVWTKYPSAMIGKVAEVLALKRSFAINGVVSEEEMGAEYRLQEPANSTQAQKEVLDHKIAEMKAGKSYAEVSSPEPRYEASDADIPTEIGGAAKPPMEQAAASIKARLEQFAKIKAAVGNEAYYRIMGAAGYEHANQITNLSQARAIYRELAAEYDDQKRRESVEAAGGTEFEEHEA